MRPTWLRHPIGSTAVLTALLCVAAPASAHRASGGGDFVLGGPDLTPGRPIALSHVYDRGACRGGNISPTLAWSDPPTATRSFALLMFDSDAPGGWWHWLVFDIPPQTRSLPANAGNPDRHLLPVGALQGRNDYGATGYGGPCPPPGTAHHYHITLYALRVATLGLTAGADGSQIEAKVRASAIAKAQLTVLYRR